MGQKVNPHGMRVGVIKDWDSRWYASEEKVGDLIVEDQKIRSLSVEGKNYAGNYVSDNKMRLEMAAEVLEDAYLGKSTADAKEISARNGSKSDLRKGRNGCEVLNCQQTIQTVTSEECRSITHGVCLCQDQRSFCIVDRQEYHVSTCILCFLQLY